MRYYAPRLKNSDKRWYYTVTHDDMCRPVGYCAGWDEEIGAVDLDLRKIIEASLEEKRRFYDKYHPNGHGTPEEACDCYRSYLIDQRLVWRREDGVQRRCEAEGCLEWTEAYADVEGHVLVLCESHRTPEMVERLFPRISEISAS